jgi:hypothetical protein
MLGGKSMAGPMEIDAALTATGAPAKTQIHDLDARGLYTHVLNPLNHLFTEPLLAMCGVPIDKVLVCMCHGTAKNPETPSDELERHILFIDQQQAVGAPQILKALAAPILLGVYYALCPGPTPEPTDHRLERLPKLESKSLDERAERLPTQLPFQLLHRVIKPARFRFRVVGRAAYPFVVFKDALES